MAKRHLLHACALSALIVGGASPALAQIGGDPVPAQAAPDAGVQADIIVTGSLIRGTPEDAAVPVTVISADQLAKQGAPTAVELLKNLPIANGVVGDANQFDNRAQGSEGVASVNLRGLGPQRTLVLLNGRRMVASGLGIPIVDVNMFPAAAIGRIELLKDGAAATYGSDAIAGVVNFITRTDLDGFLASGDYRYIKGSDGDYGGSLVFGHSQDGFRVLASAGYQRRSELRFTDRDFAVRPYTENPQGAWTGGGNPGNFDFNGPAIGGVNLTTDLGCADLGGFRSRPGSTTDRCFTQFGQFDNLVEPEERFQAYVETEFDVTDRASLKLSALYAFNNTRVTSSPSYLPTLPPSGNAALGNGALFVVPSYAPAYRDYCATYGAAAGCNPAGGGAFGAPVLFRPFLLGGNPLFQGGSNDRGSTVSKRETEAMRFTGDLSVDLTDNLNFTTGFSWSEYLRDYDGTDTFGDLLQNALAGFGGPSCAYASTASRAGLTTAQLAALAGTNGCTYFNPFSTAIAQNPISGQTNPNYAGTRNPAGFSLTPGAGLINDIDTIDLFFRTPNTRVRTRQFVADAVVSGQTGIELPGGQVAFALGAQYRKETFARVYNDDSNLAINPCPGTPLNPGATCSPQTGALGFLGTNLNQFADTDVYALYAELQVPIIEAINLQLSARYEDYGGEVGSTFDPQARVKVNITDWLGIRGGVGTTFRGPPGQSLGGSVVSLQFIGNGFRAVDVLGNPALEPESATTYNAGVLVEHGGFTASVDYFRYEFKGPIESEPVGGLTSALFGATGSANCGNPAYAALQARFTFNTNGCGINNVNRLQTRAFNSADVTTSGLDFQANYRADLGDETQVTVGGVGTYVIEYKVADVVVEGITVQPAFDAVGLLNFQTTAYPIPQWRGNWYVQGDHGPHSLRLQFNYIDGYRDQRTAAVFGPNPGALAGGSVTRGQEIGAFKTFDATYRLALDTGTTFTLAAVNILDRDPPFARLDPNYDSFTASPLGFTLKAGVSQKF
jgi:iron complex outermembrane receptor protein